MSELSNKAIAALGILAEFAIAPTLPKTEVKFSDIPSLSKDNRVEREFAIKGKIIIAYSKKDAIKRYKHGS